ncbi:Sulfurtransferase TusE [Zhongshania aliphaticivorans]|uniref:Sulfurtransferase n=1 Tax=Zhongshania aliphaticivorans TaxID=1470434 RepID=A0A5S9NG50_9GAMM|nr:TusE/DsrC/DsvC family sulfur relay protein [Zhongshania aliphaticivorans]CAA0089433.1 Sulfurtransferase TusE [Zhongshania aliphaticivorans]CAA0096213.1 Sulfurtransferase TusE [Zhongshania aliphaticivorans]
MTTPQNRSNPTIATDKEGYLKNLSDWSPKVAESLAAQCNIELSDEHWELINLAQRFYHLYNLSPAMRPLVKYAKMELGANKGNSIYFLKLFPDSPAKTLSKIAGLPRPDNCL